MSRILTAFLIAPLVVPVLLFPYLRGLLTTDLWFAVGLIVAAIVAYVGFAVIGIPAYLLLSARNWTSIWNSLVVGFFAGALMWLVFIAVFALLLEQGGAGILSSLTDMRTLKGVLWPGGVAGAAVGAVFWLIARPDRQRF